MKQMARYILRLMAKVNSVVIFNLRNLLFLFQDSHKYPLVSFVVPLYNEERFVIDCLKSLKSQSYKNFECIVVNDCSTDRSRELVQWFIKSDSRFRLVEHEINRGLSAARNTGLKHARGKYVSFMDSDDYLLPHSIWRRVRTIERSGSPNDVGAYCAVLKVPESGRTQGIFLARFRPVADAEWKDFVTCRGECPFTPHAPLLRTEVLRKFAGFDESMRKGAEDWEYWTRLMRFGYRFIPSGNFGAAYRQKSRSMVRAMPVYHVREALRLLNQAYRHLPDGVAAEGAPYIFREPLGYYDEVIIKFKRLVHYAAMVYMSGDMDGFAEIIGSMTPDSGFYLERHVDIGEHLDQAMARYLCLDEDGFSRRKSELAPMKKEIYDAIAGRVGLWIKPVAHG